MESLINFDSTNLEPMILQDKTCSRCLEKDAKQTSFQDAPYCTFGFLEATFQEPAVRPMCHQVGEEARPASGQRAPCLLMGRSFPLLPTDGLPQQSWQTYRGGPGAWTCSLVVEHVPGVHRAWGSILSTTNEAE